MVKNILKVKTFTEEFLSYKPKMVKNRVSLTFSQVAVVTNFDVIWVEF